MMEEKRKDEFEMKAELEAKRKEIKTIDDLMDFLKYVEENCNYDYGVAPRSIAQAALATAWYMAEKMGITGFQAGFVMWDFIRDWQYPYNKCGLKITDYDDMLYPQYEDRYEKIITNSTWRSLQEQAMKKLEDRKHGHPDVIAHWEKIVRGEVPFGYKVRD